MPQTQQLQPGEKADILEEVKDLIPDYQQWLETENSLFQGRKPKDLVGTEEEERLRDVFRNIRYGGIS